MAYRNGNYSAFYVDETFGDSNLDGAGAGSDPRPFGSWHGRTTGGAVGCGRRARDCRPGGIRGSEGGHGATVEGLSGTVHSGRSDGNGRGDGQIQAGYGGAGSAGTGVLLGRQVTRRCGEEAAGRLFEELEALSGDDIDGLTDAVAECSKGDELIERLWVGGKGGRIGE